MVASANAAARHNCAIHRLYVAQDFDACLALCEAALGETGGRSEEALFTKALILRQRGQVQESLALFQQARGGAGGGRREEKTQSAAAAPRCGAAAPPPAAPPAAAPAATAAPPPAAAAVHELPRAAAGARNRPRRPIPTL